MFGWRRRTEGFEWREYVRTTVLIRRRDRQRRADEVREAALNQIKEQRDRGIEAGKSVLGFAGETLARIARAAGRGTKSLAALLFRAIFAVTAPIARATGTAARSVLQKMPSRPAVPVLMDIVWLTAARSPIRMRHIAGGITFLGLVYGIAPMLQGQNPARKVIFEPIETANASIAADEPAVKAPVKAVRNKSKTANRKGSRTAAAKKNPRPGETAGKI